MKKFAITVLIVFAGLLHARAQEQRAQLMVDVGKAVGDMKPVWAWFGYDEPNYTTRENGKKLLTELQALSKVPVYVRAHNLLTSKGNSAGPDLKWGYTDAYKEDAAGTPIYNWLVVDSIVDTYIKRGMKPLMEVGFMPKALSAKPEPYEHTWSKNGNIWTGWTQPPKDYNKWRELVYQWAKHSVERYGKEEVKTWMWELWNEPDIGYWSGTFEEFCKLYDYTVDGLKKACPECTIGGPHTTNPGGEKAFAFLTNFIEHCLTGKNYATGKTGTPLQFLAFHAKGAPELVDGHIRMNMGTQLKSIDRAFNMVSKHPKLKNIPIIIGENDPEGCAACSEKREPRYGYRNGTMYPVYTAASYARLYELMDKYKVNLKGAVTWAFEFEDQEWFAGFRDLATNGINKPVLNVFRMFGLMQGKRVEVNADGGLKAADIITAGVRARADVNALASTNGNAAWIMVWNYHDDDVKADAAPINLSVKGLTNNKVLVKHYRVDDVYSNSFTAWKEMGKPQKVNAEQFKTLERAGQLSMLTSPEWKNVTQGTVDVNFDLPRQGVSLIELTWK